MHRLSLILAGSLALAGIAVASSGGARQTEARWVITDLGTRPPAYGSPLRLGATRSSGAVAISDDGRTAVVGDSIAEPCDRGVCRGAARLFVRSGARWKLIHKVAPNDRPPGFGRSVALSATGEVVVVGAESTVNVDDAAPAVFVLIRSGARWNVAQVLRADDRRDGFGTSVAVSSDGTMIVVGDPKAPPDGVGVAHVLIRTGSGWEETTTLVSTSEDFSFGYTVALTGDGRTLLVRSIGQADIFTRSGRNWKHTASLVPGRGFVSLANGAISPDGTVAVLTDDDVHGDVAGPGRTYVFARKGRSWANVQTIIEPGAPRTWNEFGDGVAVARGGRTLLVGAPLTHVDREGVTRGAVYVFTRTGAGRWQHVQTLRPRVVEDSRRWVDMYGKSIAVTPDASQVIVGALAPAFAYSR